MSDRTTSSPTPPLRIIGLTGGVGMGKSTISLYLKNQYHLPILDADIYSRDAVQPGSAVLSRIRDRYGSYILQSDGTLDRKRLGSIVFSSNAERLWLEQQIHPFVRDRIEQDIKTLTEQGQQTIVLDVPLLFEARMTDLVTEIWVVQCSREQQMERLINRETELYGTPPNVSQIQARINSQMAIAKKVQRADVIIDNSSTLTALHQAIDAALLKSHPAQSTEEDCLKS